MDCFYLVRNFVVFGFSVVLCGLLYREYICRRFTAGAVLGTAFALFAVTNGIHAALGLRSGLKWDFISPAGLKTLQVIVLVAEPIALVLNFVGILLVVGQWKSTSALGVQQIR